MTTRTYFAPHGGMPPQSQIITTRAVFTEAYAVLTKGTMTDIVTSCLPFWDKTRLWILARPLSGFAETFSQYIMEVQPGGGSDKPESDPEAEAAFFVAEGQLTITFKGEKHILTPGGFAYLPPGSAWTAHNNGGEAVRFHWFRKAYERVDGLGAPDPIFTSDQAIEPVEMAGTDGQISATRFIDSNDLRHDMNINIVSFKPGGILPFPETHVMEHGLYVIQGKGNYLLNKDWVEVEAGDFMWLRAFCPQACYTAGPDSFRYLLYKDVNRHAKLRFR